MDINNLILSDEALEVIDNGTWVGDFDDAPGVEFLVTGLKSKEAQKALREKQQILRGKQRGRPISDMQLANITQEILYEIVLKDWRGLKSDGKEIPYSKNQAKEWITSRNGEKFTELVLKAAQRVDAEAEDFVEEVTKKLTTRLRWALMYPDAKKVIEDYERFNQPIPEDLIAPDLNDIEHWYWEAFWELSTDRQIGMSDGPIPWSSIKNYCDDDSFATIIRAMDRVYMGHKSGEGQVMTKEKFRKG